MGFWSRSKKTQGEEETDKSTLTATERPMAPLMDLSAIPDLIQAAKTVTHPWFDEMQIDAIKSVGGRMPGTKAQRIKEYASAGEWLIRPGMSEPEYLRRWVAETEFLKAIHMTRKRQIARFAHPARVIGDGGWRITMEDPDVHPTDEQKKDIRYIRKFLMNCGDVSIPSERKIKGRDNFFGWLAKILDDSLTFDMPATETQAGLYGDKRMKAFNAIDGATIRLLDPETGAPEKHGTPGNPAAFCQLIDNHPVAYWGHKRLIITPRNPSTSIYRRGYGEGEAEMAMRATHALWHFVNLNLELLADNHIPRGFLWLKGAMNRQSQEDVRKIFRGGTGKKRFNLPIWMTDDNAQADVKFIQFQNFTDVMFERQATFFIALVCAVYGMDAEEINYTSFASRNSALSGSDTAERLASSQDKGLYPLMSWIQDYISEIICEILPEKAGEYIFEWPWLKKARRIEDRVDFEKVCSVDEYRAVMDLKPYHDKVIGESPLNPTHTILYQAQKGLTDATSDMMSDVDPEQWEEMLGAIEEKKKEEPSKKPNNEDE